MVQLNKDERVWVCFELARVQNAHAVQGLWLNCRADRKVPTIHAILKDYRKYRQHGTRQNRNKVNSGRFLVFSYIVIKEDSKDKKFWFQSTTSSRLLQLVAQSIFVRL